MSASLSLKRGWCPGALRPMRTGDGLLVRLRITGGIVSVGLAAAIAEAASAYGNGLIDLSGRANLQIRGISDETLPGLTDRLSELGLLDDDADAEAIRNVLASPLAGIAPDALLDIRPIVRRLEAQITGHPELRRLPSKFSFLVDDGGSLSLVATRADIRFDAVAPTRMKIGLGGTAALARPAGFCHPDEVPNVALRLARDVLAEPAEPKRLVGHTSNVPHAEVPAEGRPRSTHDGPASFEAPLRGAPQDEEPGTGPVGATTLGSLHLVGLGVPFGRWNAADLAAVARAAETAGAGELRLTPWRIVLIAGPEGTRAAALLAACAPHAITRPDDPRLALTTCTGAPGCDRGTTPTHRDALALAPLAARIRPGGIGLHLSGCRKGCARPEPAPATLVGRDGRYDLVLDGHAGDDPALAGLSLREAEAALARLGHGA